MHDEIIIILYIDKEYNERIAYVTFVIDLEENKFQINRNKSRL
jgi:hypothetical protein